MELCSMLCGSLDEKGVSGRMDTCICMVESLAVHLKLSHCLLIGYTPIQKRFFKNVMYMYITICEIDRQSRFDA